MSILTPKEVTIQTPDQPGTLQPASTLSSTTPPSPTTPASVSRDQIPFEIKNGQTGMAPEPVPGHAQEPQHIVAIEDPCSPERLRNQYFEHLYTSNTSLAFYVKGPLSRARAHVRSTAFPLKAILELSDFYEQSILTTKKIDLKYKESLSNIVKGLGSEHGSGDLQKKRQKKKKPQQKLGKDCLWPEEEESISKWWRSRDLKSAMRATSQAEEMRKELADLRMRESEMQMLLILEVMLLNLAFSKLSEEQKTPPDPEVKVESIEDDPSAMLAKTPQKQKSKKKRDLTGELDTIVDRLCIWHTVGQDELGTAVNTGNSSSMLKQSDSLRDFCKDVLLPFYSAKLPEQVKSISRKLGGPEISPKRPKPVPHQGQSRAPAMGASSSSHSRLHSRSGQVHPLARRTLERVLSEDQAHRHASPPTTLSRSSTAPLAMNGMIPTLKREPSERPLSRGGMSMLVKSASFSNREIDLVSDSRAHEVKRRKLDRLAQQKQELDAAIEALRRPSRTTVAGAFMDDVEKRAEQTKTVQITATPRARRVGDRAVIQGHDHSETELLHSLPPLAIAGQQQDRDKEMMTTVVPSSTAKPSSSGISIHPSRSSATKRAVLSAIHETPSRGMEGKTTNPLGLARHQPRPILSSANANDDHNKERGMMMTPAREPRKQTTSKRNDDDDDVHMGTQLSPAPISALSSSRSQSQELQSSTMSRSRRPVLFTPIKKSDVSVEYAFRDAPEIPERAGKMMDRVMGGKARAFPSSFGAWDEVGAGRNPEARARVGLQNSLERAKDAASPVLQADGNGDDGDIYAKLGWNDDDFDI
ncbi:hypothetical protein A1O3_05677 [Capronia epimyces CBS 606.96]|uniref:DNA replication regulator Sld3 C-terminal domain-containing protein n=1 Tax=Capronia epimyces CBS 606.96 TaxID=1182542 RepID=W9XWS3_9EURO|nr:uncharacterized protein A1O3_05677 [Capronia epimyces CBS 606.96]EXJ85002.1 hypothetical protein A1O3_05677 [Capronia epimyces CBS 606.96]